MREAARVRRSWSSTDWRTSSGAHTPDVCYPATGFRAVLPSRDKDLEIRIPEKATPAQFRLQHFVKSKAGQTDYREVCYSFRNAGQWAPDMGKNWKSFRYHPGMFKVQVQCQASSSAKIDESAIKELLERIVQEIERGVGLRRPSQSGRRPRAPSP